MDGPFRSLDKKPYRSHVDDAKAAAKRASAGDGSELRNPETFVDMQKRLLRDFGEKALGLIDPGIALAADAGTAAGRGNYGEAALALPFLALNAMGGKGVAKARSAFRRPGGVPNTIKLPHGETAASAPLEPLVKARLDYMRSAGIPQTAVTATQPIDPARSTRIASQYDGMADDLEAPGVRDSYQALADETRDQFDAITKAGYKFNFMKRGPDGQVVDPYAESPALGYKAMRDNRELEIFPTEGGFGSANEAAVNHPLLADSGRTFADGSPATNNDLFRAVHDSFGHFGSGNAFFRAPGEDRAFQMHATMYSPKAQGAMTSELRGQNSWLNYGPHGEANRTASAADTIFADQKTGLLPSSAWSEGMAATAPTNVPFLMQQPLDYDE